MSMEHARKHAESAARDQAELRDLLQKVISESDNMRALQSLHSMQSSRPVKESLRVVHFILCYPYSILIAYCNFRTQICNSFKGRILVMVYGYRIRKLSNSLHLPTVRAITLVKQKEN